jgi:hypothetical protein
MVDFNPHPLFGQINFELNRETLGVAAHQRGFSPLKIGLEIGLLDIRIGLIRVNRRQFAAR